MSQAHKETVTQAPHRKIYGTNVRILDDVYEVLRKEAFDTRTAIAEVVDDALRSYLKLPPQKEA